MAKRIESVQGLFGQTIHYEDGVKVGESWPGLFGGSSNHYDAGGNFVGYSDQGIIADKVHHSASGEYLGTSCKGLFGQDKHYGAFGDHVGDSWDGVVSDHTSLNDSTFDLFSDSDD